ncbi:hypothetical protein, partial [Hydrotalea sp.]|uniref:hypothetical protein n=1 Tax=Hydrotalea sp. TaxID=2881279 RepID=UPI003D11DA87
MRYEIRRRGDGGKAIFDENGNRISEWFDEIWEDGLVKGESKYYIAEKDGKEAVFDISGRMISPEWFDYVNSFLGLVAGQSKYCIARENKNMKYIIFDENGRIITPDWFDEIKE